MTPDFAPITVCAAAGNPSRRDIPKSASGLIATSLL
jgi:hypothetical protein